MIVPALKKEIVLSVEAEVTRHPHDAAKGTLTLGGLMNGVIIKLRTAWAYKRGMAYIRGITVLSNFTLLSKTPTHLYGTQNDQVYVRKNNVSKIYFKSSNC